MNYYWTCDIKNQFLVMAIPFGLGPRVAAERLVMFFGSKLRSWRYGSLEDFPINWPFRALFNFGVPVPPPIQRSSLNVWIDCLCWLRQSLAESVDKYHVILAERFFRTNPGLSESRIIEVRPLLSKVDGHAQTDHTILLLSFGGVRTPYSGSTRSESIPLGLVHALLRNIGGTQFQKLIAYLPEKVCQQLSDLNGPFELRPLGHKSYPEEFHHAGSVILQPGLYGPWEAFQEGKDTRICGPMSFTQYWQAEEYTRVGIHIFNQWRHFKRTVAPNGGDPFLHEKQYFEELEQWWPEVEIDADEILDQWAQEILAGNDTPGEFLAAQRMLIRESMKLPHAHKVLREWGI